MKHFLMTLALAGAALPAALAQSFCASDGQPRPVALLERFVSADCDGCWSDPATPQPAARAVAIDWIVPGSKGDDAPLSAAARRDGLDRLQALGRSVPSAAEAVAQPVLAGGAGRSKLRVSQGLPFNDYVAASIELKPRPPPSRGPYTAWLVLVETVPAGAEGTPIERNLVRNALQRPWDGRAPLSKGEQNRFFEARSFYLPEGTRGERLRVVGWVEDAKGRVVVAAQGRCDETGR